DWIRPFGLRIHGSGKSLPLRDLETLGKHDRLALFAQKSMQKMSGHSEENRARGRETAGKLLKWRAFFGGHLTSFLADDSGLVRKEVPPPSGPGRDRVGVEQVAFVHAVAVGVDGGVGKAVAGLLTGGEG